MVGTVTAMGMLVAEMVLYIIRTTELERFQPKRRRNEEMGQKGLLIPMNPLDDYQWHLRGGRAQKVAPPATVGTTTTTAGLVMEKSADGGVSDGAGEEVEAAPLLGSQEKDKHA